MLCNDTKIDSFFNFNISDMMTYSFDVKIYVLFLKKKYKKVKFSRNSYLNGFTCGYFFLFKIQYSRKSQVWACVDTRSAIMLQEV